MPSISHQTINLSKGKHASPEEGACVMELASMLAGEPFTDHPISVCPVLAAFLGVYDDSIDDEWRQDLYDYASRVVGTRGTLELQRRRSERLADWAINMYRSRWGRLRPHRRLQARRLRRTQSFHAVARHAVQAIRRPSATSHGQVLALLDELVDMGAVAHEPASAHRPPTDHPTLDQVL